MTVYDEQAPNRYASVEQRFPITLYPAATSYLVEAHYDFEANVHWRDAS